MTINVVRRTGLTERDWQEVERAYASASPYSYVALDDFFTHPLSLVFKENYSRIWADSTRTGKRTTFMSDPKIPEIESVANELKKRPPAIGAVPSLRASAQCRIEGEFQQRRCHRRCLDDAR